VFTLLEELEHSMYPSLQMLWSRSLLHSYVSRIHYQFLRRGSELNQIDKPDLLLNYLSLQRDIWIKDSKCPRVVETMIASCIIERYNLDAKAGSTML
jgi:hypothetical protein